MGCPHTHFEIGSAWHPFETPLHGEYFTFSSLLTLHVDLEFSWCSLGGGGLRSLLMVSNSVLLISFCFSALVVFNVSSCSIG